MATVSLKTCIGKKRFFGINSSQVNVQRQQQDSRWRQNQYMHGVEAGEGDHPHAIGGTEQLGQIRADARRHRGDLGGHRGAPIGTVVPGQKVSSQAVGQSHQQQNHADHPGGFARLLICAVEKHLHHVQHHYHDDHAGAPMMQAANQRASR
jgi:hypothetical protein